MVKQSNVASEVNISQPIMQGSTADELTKLANLKAQGILTQAEFDIEKAKLLSR